MNLLIIDDEKYVIESIRQNVDWEKTGIDHVYSATLVRQAEHIMENIPIEIVLCDIVMPQCTGLELIKHFREQGYEMQVIFLTSYARFEYAQKAITLDSVDYLLKPVDFNLLTETLRKARDKAESIQGFRQYQKKQDDHTERSMDRIKKYIDEHFQEDIRREDLAELVYLNVDYMSRVFKKDTGVSISAYLIQARVEKAKVLLTESMMPVNAIAQYVGYSNFSYFTKMFKDNTGYSPLEYRRKYMVHGADKNNHGRERDND